MRQRHLNQIHLYIHTYIVAAEYRGVSVFLSDNWEIFGYSFGLWGVLEIIRSLASRLAQY